MSVLPFRGWGAAAVMFIAAVACAEDAPPTQAGTISIVAFAADAHVVVMRSPDGKLRRYAVGETVVDSDWRVVELTPAGVILQSAQRLHGQALRIILDRGDSADLDALSRASDSAQQPLLVPERVSVQSSRISAKPTR